MQTVNVIKIGGSGRLIFFFLACLVFGVWGPQRARANKKKKTK